MKNSSVAFRPFLTDQARRSYLEKSRIAVGSPADAEEFHREHQRFERLLPQRRPLKVLDIGCGTGAWSVHWAVRGCKSPASMSTLNSSRAPTAGKS